MLVTSGLLPILALSGAFGFVTLRAQRTTVRTGIETTARFGADLASTKLDEAMHAVNMIAQSPTLDGALDRERFRTLALRIRATQPTWRTISIADPQGNRLLDVPMPIAGVPHGRVLEPASLARAVATRQPVVGDVAPGPHGLHAFAIRAPVIRDGKVRYVVSAVVAADSLIPLLQFRTLAPGWRAVIIDRAGNLVAASDIAGGRLAPRVSAQGLHARQSGRPDFYEYERRDGTGAIAWWAPIRGTGWSTHVSAPRALYTGAVAGALLLLCAVVIVCLALLAILIWLLVGEIRQDQARGAAETQRQRMEALGQLTGGVAHDFNNLLTPIMGGLDMIRLRVAGDEKATRYAEAALASAERARSLVARLLAFARRQTLTTTTVSLPEMFDSIRDLLDRSVGPTTRVDLIAPAASMRVAADRSQLELALLNLVINARDAMPDGGTVRIEATMVTIEQPTDVAPGAYVAIAVSDTGTGMDAETLRRAIDPFFTTKSGDKGTGLGLSMVHGFAAQSGGIFRLDSQPGTGTIATLILPHAPEPAAAPIASSAPHRAGGGKVLVVDDDAPTRETTAAMLTAAGYQVTEAGSAHEALDLLARSDRYEAVVTDYFMPGATGADLIRALGERHAALPVLLITGFADAARDVPDVVPRLSKPFRSDELIDSLARLGRVDPAPQP